MVKDGCTASAFDLGLVFAAGGLASMLCAIAAGPSRPAAPEHHLHVGRVDAGDAGRRRLRIARPIWQLMVAAALFNGLETAGTIVWATLKQRHVPGALLGRVSSLDWLISIGLLPLSFALTGPVSAAIGARRRWSAAGMLGAIVTAGALLVPGMRAVEEPACGLPHHAAHASTNEHGRSWHGHGLAGSGWPHSGRRRCRRRPRCRVAQPSVAPSTGTTAATASTGAMRPTGTSSPPTRTACPDRATRHASDRRSPSRSTSRRRSTRSAPRAR